MARRGEVDDFMWVLGIALVLLVAVGLFSYFVPYTGPLTNITMESFSPGEVGFVQDFVSRTVDLKTFSVGENQTESLRTYPQIELSASIFGGEPERTGIKVPDYLLETARGVRISFDVAQTNMYGALVVKWNGRAIVEQPMSARYYELYIDREHIRESNTLEVYTTGPGLMFWASSVYIIKNFNVNVEYGPYRSIPFEILNSEMQRFDRAELSAYASGTGRLDIKINGAPIYSDSPTGMIKQEFTLFNAPIKPGQNILTFLDETGTYVLRDTLFKIYITGDKSIATERFNVTDENYNFLANNIFFGKVEYRIDSITRQGGIEIEINGNQLQTPAPRVGWNSAFFTADMVRAGENTITFSGTGSFNVPEVIVGLER